MNFRFGSDSQETQDLSYSMYEAKCVHANACNSVSNPVILYMSVGLYNCHEEFCIIWR